MEFMTLLSKVSELGILVVCGAAIIWQIINNHKEQSKRTEEYDNLMQKLIERQKEESELLLNQLINKIDNRHTITSQEDKDISKIEKELEFYLTEILKTTNANRVSLFRYHNGGKDYNGRSFLRMSMTNEVVKGGTALIQPQSQNLFRSMFFSLVHSLEDNGCDYIEDIENLRDVDNGLYGYLKNFGIESKYTIAVHNDQGDIVGFITLDFASKTDCIPKEVEACLQEKKIKIETLLNL